MEDSKHMLTVARKIYNKHMSLYAGVDKMFADEEHITVALFIDLISTRAEWDTSCLMKLGFSQQIALACDKILSESPQPYYDYISALCSPTCGHSFADWEIMAMRVELAYVELNLDVQEEGAMRGQLRFARQLLQETIDSNQIRDEGIWA